MLMDCAGVGVVVVLVVVMLSVVVWAAVVLAAVVLAPVVVAPVVVSTVALATVALATALLAALVLSAVALAAVVLATAVNIATAKAAAAITEWMRMSARSGRSGSECSGEIPEPAVARPGRNPDRHTDDVREAPGSARRRCAPRSRCTSEDGEIPTRKPATRCRWPDDPARPGRLRRCKGPPYLCHFPSCARRSDPRGGRRESAPPIVARAAESADSPTRE